MVKRNIDVVELVFEFKLSKDAIRSPEPLKKDDRFGIYILSTRMVGTI
jgi:hypothetical protein